MNIIKEARKDQTAIIKITVAEADYTAEVDKKLREYKRKANIPGFRPGMVPMGIINKMYRKGVVAEVAYKMASDSCFEYIEKEGIDYMGDVLPSDEQGAFDFDNNTEHEFIFEVGLAPKVELELTEKDKVTRYKIKVDEEMRSGYRGQFLRTYGRLVDVDVVEKDEAVMCTLDNGDIKSEDAYVGLISMSEEERKPFIGKKVGDQMIVNVNELYKSAQQRASVLGVKENELADIKPEFNLTITKIRKYADPEMNEEFFKMAFPEGNVTTEEQFEKFIDEKIAAELKKESDYVFSQTLREYLVEKANLILPEGFLKRWLLAINEGKFTMEEIEKDFAPFAEMMKWSAVQKHFAKTLGVEVKQEDMLNEAKAYAAAQFAQYGMMNVAEEMLSNYAQQILSNKEEANKLIEKVYEQKVIEAVTPLVKVSNKSVTIAELNKILSKKAK
ncbi:MAG: trigger factor [Tidjanibacter sp.]|nr:trigger factor [Tidjanibacter sp.]